MRTFFLSAVFLFFTYSAIAQEVTSHSIVNSLSGLSSMMTSSVTGMMNNATQNINNEVSNVRSAVTTSVNGIVNTAAQIVNSEISNIRSTVTNSVSGIVNTATQTVNNGISNIKSAVTTSVNGIVNTATNEVSNIRSTVTTSVNGIINTATQTVSNGISSVTSAVTTSINGIVNTATQALNKGLSSITSIGMTSLTGGINAISQGLIGGLTSFGSLDLAGKLAYIQKLAETVRNEGKYISDLSNLQNYDFPVAIKKELGGIEYSIIFDSLVITPQGGKLVASMWLEVPGTPLHLAFRSGEIPFNAGGIQAGSVMKLLDKAKLPFGPKMNLFLKDGLDGCKINFDCDGFQGLDLKGELKLDSTIFFPEDASGTVLPGSVKAQFSAKLSQWSELIASVSLPRFQVKSIKGFSFELDNATLDVSDVSNPAGFQIPKGYDLTRLEGSMDLWQGIFIKKIKVTLPAALKSKDKVRPVIQAENMILDDMGLSAAFSGIQLLTLENGKLGDWAFSLDTVKVAIVCNKLSEGGFNGKITFPIAKKDQLFSYKAVIDENSNYFFTVTNQSTLDFKLWAAKATINPNSTIQIDYINNEFLPKAILHGKINVTAGGASGASLASVKFEGFTIQTVEPFINIESFDLGSDLIGSKMANFPINLKSIGFRGGSGIGLPKLAGLNFDMFLNLVKTDDGGFGGGGAFTVWGGNKMLDKERIWEFSHIQLSKIAINIDGDAFKIKGEIIQYQKDKVFGDGFKGMIDAYFTPGIKIKASAQFGNVDNLRYWYVDGLVGLPVGIPIFTGVAIYGFGGGAYYHMTPNFSGKQALPKADQIANDNTTTAGKSLSGVSYIPDPNVGLGIKATIIIGTSPTSKTFNGDITFEISFTTSGSLNKVSLLGNGYIMEDLYNGNPSTPVIASVYIEYDNQNGILYGNADVYMNIKKVIKGTGPNNLAGNVNFLFSKDKWHIFAGTPDVRNGVQLFGMFEISSYLMVGKDLPPMPDPPVEVTRLMDQYDAPDRNDITLMRGDGFAFGASLTLDTGEKEFLIFYGRLAMVAGFDIMLKDYGKVTCGETGERVGINGWYASGQLYGYGVAKVGVKVDIALIKGNFAIMEASLAMLLQARLPNPSWVKGDVAGEYNILGGALEGSFKFGFEMGKKCTLDNTNPLQGFTVIADCSPAQSEKDVDVFTNPQATFIIAPGKEFSLKDNFDRLRTFRVGLVHFALIDGANTISGIMNYNSKGDVISFTPNEILPGKKDIKFTVKVKFEEKKYGTWSNVQYQNADLTESKEFTFTTGVAPDYIPESNVEYSYPLKDQFNFYKDELTTGYVQLKKGQSYLFQGTDWDYKGRFEKEGSKLDFGYSYDIGSMRLSFIFPSGISTNSIYKMSLNKTPKGAANAVDYNVTTSTKEKINIDEAKVNIRDQKVSGSLSVAQETELYALHLRSSSYETLASKWNALMAGTFGWTDILSNGISVFNVTLRDHEVFDDYEIYGGSNFKRLIEFSAINSNTWFNAVKANVYDGYPITSEVTISRRKIDSLGLIPAKAIMVSQFGIPHKKLNAEDYRNGTVNTSSQISFLKYFLCPEASKDLYELTSKSLTNSRFTQYPNLMRYINYAFPNLGFGTYKMQVKYVPPGQPEKNIVLLTPQYK